MELKTSVLNRITSTKKLLSSAIIVITIATLIVSVFSGCTKKEETPMPETRQLVIPSELEPEAVLPAFGGEIFYECGYEIGSGNNKCDDVQFFAELHELENGFIKGYVRTYSTYILKSGQEIGIAYPFIRILVMKYQTPATATEAFNLYTERIDLKYSVIEGVKIKWDKHAHEPIVYMLQSNNFIIYIDGSDEPCTDAVSRIIELYSVPIDNKY
jgi:hypothetical protein